MSVLLPDGVAGISLSSVVGFWLFIINVVVKVVTVVLSVAYWHIDLQGQIVRIGNCLKS